MLRGNKRRKAVDPETQRKRKEKAGGARPKIYNGLGGRPRVWEEADMADVTAKCKFLVEQMDASDDDICNFFKIGMSTLHRYKHRYPAFANALVRTEAQQVKLVESALIRSATGFRTRALKIMQDGGVPILVEHEKFIEPSVAAQLGFLKAKKPDQYGNKLELGGDPAKPVRFVIDGLYADGLPEDQPEQQGVKDG